jgi:hypothetical protein
MKSFIEVHYSVQITSMNQNAKISVLPFDYIFMAYRVRFVFSGDWAALSFAGNICSIRTVSNSQTFLRNVIYRAVWWSGDVK